VVRLQDISASPVSAKDLSLTGCTPFHLADDLAHFDLWYDEGAYLLG
jgi:hypothetical protein